MLSPRISFSSSLFLPFQLLFAYVFSGGLAYVFSGVPPSVVSRKVISSNILSSPELLMDAPSDIKNSLLDRAEGMCRAGCRKLNVQPRTLGMLLRSFHSVTPFIWVCTALFGSITFCRMTIVFMSASLISFFKYRGCWLTRLERRLCGDDFTIVDPIIETRGLQVNNRTRYEVSTPIGVAYLMVLLIIYFYRFHYSSTQSQ